VHVNGIFILLFVSLFILYMTYLHILFLHFLNQSNNLSCFTGDIMNFYDVTSNTKFDTPVEGEGMYEEGTCIDVPPPA